MSVLADVVAAVEPELAAHAARSPGDDRFGAVIADPTRRFVIEAVYEGYHMHYGEPRAFADLDDDLRLLGGDALYALGLARLAEDGDLEAVCELSDLISASARAHAEGRPEEAESLWSASARTLGRAAARGRPAIG